MKCRPASLFIISRIMVLSGGDMSYINNQLFFFNHPKTGLKSLAIKASTSEISLVFGFHAAPGFCINNDGIAGGLPPLAIAPWDRLLAAGSHWFPAAAASAVRFGAGSGGRSGPAPQNTYWRRVWNPDTEWPHTGQPRKAGRLHSGHQCPRLKSEQN